MNTLLAIAFISWGLLIYVTSAYNSYKAWDDWGAGRGGEGWLRRMIPFPGGTQSEWREREKSIQRFFVFWGMLVSIMANFFLLVGWYLFHV